MTPEELEAERRAVRAASAPGELSSKQPSVALELLRMLRNAALFGLVLIALVVAIYLWFWFSPGS